MLACFVAFGVMQAVVRKRYRNYYERRRRAELESHLKLQTDIKIAKMPILLLNVVNRTKIPIYSADFIDTALAVD